jgi:hypothetical protein
MNWTTPARLREQARKLWDSGRLLAARLNGEPLFPHALRLKQPSARELTERFGEVQDWLRALRDGSREQRGHGYEIRWHEVRNRVHGSNRLPEAVILPSEADALKLIGKTAEAARFDTLTATTLDRFPELADWLARRPLTALEQARHWDEILAVLDWFRAHPRPGLYLRQLDIPGVDTKFIEQHRGLLGELLDAVLPASAVDFEATGVRHFTRRYGLRAEPPLIRFRLLDPALYLHGLADLSVPPEQFAALALPLRRVFVTENKTNGLAFPDHPASLVIFGLGYGLDRLADIPWLQQTELHYWGDIDTHGFAILNRLRATLPRTRSLLMDRATLEAHRRLWVQEPADQRFTGRLDRLTADEQQLYAELRDDHHGERVRLEQERIAYGWLLQALTMLDAS